MGAQSEPGLIVFRYDADLFYANTNRFVDDVEKLIAAAPDPVRCLVLDAGAIADIDYSAGISLSHLLDYLRAHDIDFKLARADTPLLATLTSYDLMPTIGSENIYGNLIDAVDAFQSAKGPPAGGG
jgi:MFS superfamily sulfate permease-like transporter